jgi:cell wall-associated NlpC family hydrolase
VSFSEGELEQVGRLIERLLVDPGFRAQFRREPVAVCLEMGLPGLAAEYGGSGRAAETMEMRESRSPLAGVVMAFAAEGVAFESLGAVSGQLPASVAQLLRGAGHGHLANRLGHGADHVEGVKRVASSLAPSTSPSSGAHVGAGSPLPAPPAAGNVAGVVPGAASEVPAAGVAPAATPGVAGVAPGAADQMPVASAGAGDMPVAGAAGGHAPLAGAGSQVPDSQVPVAGSPGGYVQPHVRGAYGYPVAGGQADPAQGSAENPAGVGSSQSLVEPVTSPAAGSTDAAYGSARAHAAFEAAKNELGVQYQWGGESPQTGFDCSGLMQWAYHKAGIDLPRVADQQFNVGTPVSPNDLHEGDLVFFRITGGDVDHVGMYVGHGQFIEAPRTGENVQYASLDNPYWKSVFAGARRVVPLEPPLAASGQSSPAAPGQPLPAGPNEAPMVESAGVPQEAPAQGQAPVLPSTSPPVEPGVPSSGVASVPPVPETPAAGQPRYTASFTAYDPAPGAPRATVQFLQAVQPPPGSPFAPSAPGGVEMSPQSGPGAHIAEPVAPAGDLAQLSPANSITVSSPLLTRGQEVFAAKLAELTGLNPHVIAAWALAEESGGAAQSYESRSYFNWLNIAQYDSGPGALAFVKAFSNPVTAAEQTAKFLDGQWGGASESIRAIIASAGQPPERQIAAIAGSDWASTHYDNGANLRGTFGELSGEIRIVRS